MSDIVLSRAVHNTLKLLQTKLSSMIVILPEGNVVLTLISERVKYKYFRSVDMLLILP